MKKVIVTGVTGFIGGATAEALLNHGYEVIGIGRDEKKIGWLKNFKQFRFISADFDEYLELPNRIEDNDIDMFFHFAWAGGFTLSIRDYHLQMKNASYSGDAVKSAYEIGCKKFLNAGTYNEFEILTLLLGDNFAPRYTCIYSMGKTAADVIARTLAFNYGMDYSVGLIPMPYGEMNYSPQLINNVIDHLIHGIPPKLVEGNNLYDLVYIRDIAEAMVAIGEKGKNQKAYYIGHRQLKTFRAWLEEMRDIISPDIALKFGEYKDNQVIDYNLIDLDALYQDTGFECSANFNDSMRKTVDWYKKTIAEE